MSGIAMVLIGTIIWCEEQSTEKKFSEIAMV